jgi:hypothetical protein
MKPNTQKSETTENAGNEKCKRNTPAGNPHDSIKKNNSDFAKHEIRLTSCVRHMLRKYYVHVSKKTSKAIKCNISTKRGKAIKTKTKEAN